MRITAVLITTVVITTVITNIVITANMLIMRIIMNISLPGTFILQKGGFGSLENILVNQRPQTRAHHRLETTVYRSYNTDHIIKTTLYTPETKDKTTQTTEGKLF